MPAKLSELAEIIEKTKKSSPLAAPRVLLLGASKSQSAEVMMEAARKGLTAFGENRVQEAQEKWPQVKAAFPDVKLHLIGPLQTNKVKAAVELFDVIQVLDRKKLADELAAAGGLGKEYYIQVNIGKEPQKAGVMPEEAEELLAYAKEKGLKVVGLMCVPPVSQHPAPHFAALRQMAEKMGLSELSMGMSDDFETAIRMGASCVRLGRVLFGQRA